MSLTQVSPDVDNAKPGVFEQARLRAGHIAIPLGTAISLLLIWQIGVRLFEVPNYIAPAPTDVLAVFANDYALLLRNFWPTLIESLSGFAVGNLAAILIAVAFVHSRTVEKAFLSDRGLHQHDPDPGHRSDPRPDFRCRNDG